MDEATYRKMVGDQAVDFELRMLAAGAKVSFEATDGQFVVHMTVAAAPTRLIRARHRFLSTAIWAAAQAAGLTDGLVPPPGAPSLTAG